MDSSDPKKQSLPPDQPVVDSPQPASVGVPVAGKETEAVDTTRVEELWKDVQTEPGREAGEDQERLIEQESVEDLVEIRVAPEEEEVEISPEMAELGVKAVPAAVPPVISDNGDDDQVVITLPLTEAEIEEGLHHKVRDSVRWLAEWCLRIIKMAHGKVRYASE